MFTVLIGYRSDDENKQVAIVSDLRDFWSATVFTHSIARYGSCNINNQTIKLEQILYVTIDRSKEGSENG